MAKSIMIQGTASSAGKSILVTGLCRIFRQDGHAVAPFKSQNMALNSYITPEGLEMGRAQVAQAEAAGLEPSVLMNPILLKPTGDAVSQVIVDGEVTGTMGAAEYHRRKASLRPFVRRAYETLASQCDVVVIEGAGSPAEINLREDDFVNMGMAAIADAPVVLVGDIERGGVFASLYGTVALLEPEERERVRGFVVNKFRGDVELLKPGLRLLEELTGIPVLGVIPWLDVDIDDEDSVSARLRRRGNDKPIDVAVIRLPRISNFTDFAPLNRHPAFSLRYVEAHAGLGRPDLVILPGTKNTMGDLLWMRANGIEAAIKRLAGDGVPVLGICGGYQMLGESIGDPDGVEGGGFLRGMELLPAATLFAREKVRTRIAGTVGRVTGYFAPLSGAAFEGYEIHMGQTRPTGEAGPFAMLRRDDEISPDGMAVGNVAGSYVHGLFDSGSLAEALARKMLADKGLTMDALPHRENAFQYRQGQYDILADSLRTALDMQQLYAIIGR